MFSRRLFGVAFSAALALAGCGGGPSSGPLPTVSTGPTVAPTGSSATSPSATPSPAHATPSASAVATVAPTTTPSAGTNSPIPSASPTSVAMSSLPAATAPPDAPGHTNVVPALPAAGTCRTGQIYSIYVTSPIGDTVAMTVFEPAQLCGGQTYPLVLHAPGFGGTRTQTLAAQSAPNPSEGFNVGTDISEMVYAGYGVISFDQRGMGESTGTIRVMDPDYEGKDYVSVMDWAQAKLGWLAFGPTLEGDDAHEPIMGSIGGSYGAMYQYLLLNVDRRHRLRAIATNIGPSDLNYSLFQGGAPKTLWNEFLFADGTGAGSGLNRGNFDPFVNQTFVDGTTSNAETPAAHDFFGYHSANYFDDGVAIATNGGPGTAPMLPPGTSSPKINALIWIGVRDTLFNFNNGYENYVDLAKSGGDVRLLSYQSGHNSVGLVPDPGVTTFYGATDDQDSRCGSQINSDQAQLLWMNRYLKGQSGATAPIPTQPCISFSAGDAVTVPRVTVGEAGTPFDIGSVSLVAGAGTDAPIATQTLYTAGANGAIEAGIPHVRLNVAPAAVAAGFPTIYVGIGQIHAANPGVTDLVDNQISPLRGLGAFDLDIVGGGTRLAPGDKLVLLFYGSQDQYAPSNTANAAAVGVLPVTVTGTAWLPIVTNATKI